MTRVGPSRNAYGRSRRPDLPGPLRAAAVPQVSCCPSGVACPRAVGRPVTVLSPFGSTPCSRMSPQAMGLGRAPRVLLPARAVMEAASARRIASGGLGLGAAGSSHGIPGRGQISPVAVSTSAALATVSVTGSTSKIAVTATGSRAADACVTTETCGIHDVGR